MVIPPRPRPTAHSWAGLLVLLVPALLTGMDASVLFVAAAPIGKALHPSATQWLWAMDIYSFVMAGLLITMGSLGDRLGRRRILLIGAGLFGASSALLAYAPTPGLLIASRAVMAVGGATLAPSTLSLIRSMFGNEQQRRAAVGAWTAAFVGGAVAGPIIAGILLDYFWWGAIFLINLPLMVLLLVAAPFLVVESKNPRATGFDVLGAAAALVATLSLVFAMKHLATAGIDPTACCACVVGLAAAALFITRQCYARQPLIDVRLFSNRAFTAAIGINSIGAGVISGLGALVFPFLQIVHGLTPLRSALCALPAFVGIVLGATTAAVLATRRSTRSLLITGLLATAGGFGVITLVEPRTDLLQFLIAYTVLTFGSGLTSTIATSLVLTSAPAERAGSAVGISETSGALGSALGIATLGTLAAVVYRSAMTSSAPKDTEPAALETLTGAASGTQSGPHARAILDVAYAAYTSGLTTTALVGAVLSVLLAVLAFTALRGR